MSVGPWNSPQDMLNDYSMYEAVTSEEKYDDSYSSETTDEYDECDSYNHSYTSHDTNSNTKKAANHSYNESEPQKKEEPPPSYAKMIIFFVLLIIFLAGLMWFTTTHK